MDDIIASLQSTTLTDMATTGEKELAKLFETFSEKQQKQWDVETKRKLIASKASSIAKCDGELTSQTRNYLYDIDLLVPQFTQDPDSIITIVKKTASGSLGREIQRYISDCTTPVTWLTLKSHIEKTFLSSDEAEVLRQNIESVRQGSAETLASYNRRFREAVRRAYSSQLSPDAERTLMKNYLRNLLSPEMARKASLEVSDPSLDKLLQFTEQIEAGLQRYQALGRNEEPMEINSATNPLQQIQEALHAVMVEQQKLRDDVHVGLHRTQDSSMPDPPRKVHRQPVARQQTLGQRQCYLCSGPHMAYKCPKAEEFRAHINNQGNVSKN